MPTFALNDVIKNIRDLPSLPVVVMELLDIVDQEDADIGSLAQKVSQDQSLTAKTLQLANSSYFATRIKVTTIRQAITLLGFQNVRTLITTAALAGCFPERACEGFDHKLFMHHSTTTAMAASVLARHMGINADYAFTAALLHDIGRLVLVTSFPDEYAAAIAYRIEHACSMRDAEIEIFGIDHARAGELLAIHWNFSDTIRFAIAYHHEPDHTGAGFLAAIVHIANAIVHQLASSEEGRELPASVSQTAWDALNLDDETYTRICHETQQGIDKVRALVTA